MTLVRGQTTDGIARTLMVSDRSHVRVDSSATSGFAITPNDSTDLTANTRGIFIGTGGNLRVTLIDGTSTITLTNIANGTLLPLAVKRVWSTSTTASGIVGLY